MCFSVSYSPKRWASAFIPCRAVSLKFIGSAVSVAVNSPALSDGSPAWTTLSPGSVAWTYKNKNPECLFLQSLFVVVFLRGERELWGRSLRLSVAARLISLHRDAVFNIHRRLMPQRRDQIGVSIYARCGSLSHANSIAKPTIRSFLSLACVRFVCPEKSIHGRTVSNCTALVCIHA